MRGWRWRAAAGIVAAIGLLAVGACGSEGGPAGPVALDLVGLDGSPLAIRGPAVVNFWSPDCAPCRAEMPVLEGVHRRIGGRVQIVGVDILGDASRARPFADAAGVTYPVVQDPGGRTRQALRVTSIPTTVLIAAGGRVDATHTGALTERDLDAAVARIDPGAAAAPGVLPAQRASARWTSASSSPRARATRERMVPTGQSSAVAASS